MAGQHVPFSLARSAAVSATSAAFAAVAASAAFVSSANSDAAAGYDAAGAALAIAAAAAAAAAAAFAPAAFAPLPPATKARKARAKKPVRYGVNGDLAHDHCHIRYVAWLHCPRRGHAQAGSCRHVGREGRGGIPSSSLGLDLLLEDWENCRRRDRVHWRRAPSQSSVLRRVGLDVVWLFYNIMVMGRFGSDKSPDFRGKPFWYFERLSPGGSTDPDKDHISYGTHQTYLKWALRACGFYYSWTTHLGRHAGFGASEDGGADIADTKQHSRHNIKNAERNYSSSVCARSVAAVCGLGTDLKAMGRCLDPRGLHQAGISIRVD